MFKFREVGRRTWLEMDVLSRITVGNFYLRGGSTSEANTQRLENVDTTWTHGFVKAPRTKMQISQGNLYNFEC